MSYIEIIGFITALLGVWLTIRQNILCWVINIISSAFYCIYFFELKLYADSSLQIFFVAMGIFGWINWVRISRKSSSDSYRDESMELGVESQSSVRSTPSTVCHITLKQFYTLSVLVILSTVIIAYILKKYTDASIPYADSFCMALSLAGTWLAAKKILENWTVWIVADILYVGIYVYKEAYLTAILYTIFVALAIAGYREWKRTLQTTS